MHTMALTDTAVRHARSTGKDYTLTDTDGLALFVTTQGAKSWHLRFSWSGRQSRISLGCGPQKLEADLLRIKRQPMCIRYAVHRGLDRHVQCRILRVDDAMSLLQVLCASHREYLDLTPCEDAQCCNV